MKKFLKSQKTWWFVILGSQAVCLALMLVYLGYVLGDSTGVTK